MSKSKCKGCGAPEHFCNEEAVIWECGTSWTCDFGLSIGGKCNKESWDKWLRSEEEEENHAIQS